MQGATSPTSIDESHADARRKANWARLIQKDYEIDPLKCSNCSDIMRIIALIDDPASAGFSFIANVCFWPLAACCLSENPSI